MGHTGWSTLGISLDIFGALLLSIEAIKVKNLEKAASRFRGFASSSTTTVARLRSRPFAFEMLNSLFTALLVVSLVAIILLAVRLQGTPFSFLWRVLLGLYVPIVGFLILGVRETLMLPLVFLSVVADVAVRGVAVVERRTVDGTIGIVGAVLLVMGFSFQLVGVWMS